MSLSSAQLDAFLAVAQALSFSKAAQALHITQSALSQRIQNLEEALALTLFLRDPRQVQLTEAGEKLLRHCQTRQALENDLLGELQAEALPVLSGELRLGAYSSVWRSVLLPALAPFLRANPGVRLQAFSGEMRELPQMLRRGEADFILSDEPVARAGVQTARLGEEVYTLTSSRDHPTPPDVYIDHDPEDTTTARFLAMQLKKPAPYRRIYLDEIYALMDGVAAGLGRAVIPLHLARADARLKMVKGLQPLRVPVLLHYYAQPFYSRLHQAVVKEITTKGPEFLAGHIPRG